MTTNANDTLAPRAAHSKLGTVGWLDGGRHFVRFERRLAHSVERVWAALTDAGELAKWFPEITLETREGGSFRIDFGGEGDAGCDGPSVVTGTVTRFEPLRVLECGTMRWELAPEGDGCVLVFTDVLELDRGRTPRDVTNSVLAGWHWYLDALEAALAGRYVDRTAPEVDYAPLEVPGRP